jgi:hypothetical protein
VRHRDPLSMGGSFCLRSRKHKNLRLVKIKSSCEGGSFLLDRERQGIALLILKYASGDGEELTFRISACPLGVEPLGQLFGLLDPAREALRL